ncbi:hypothetical protein [Stagnimonas aquatica]|nr:hypothetical protein [Stagnimonas aquatica]
MRTALLFGLAASLLLSACATTSSTKPEGAAIQDKPAWSKNYFKVGARLFPRCQTLQPVGSRVNDTTWCLTEEQIAQIDRSNDQARIDFQQRSAVVPVNISN